MLGRWEGCARGDSAAAEVHEAVEAMWERRGGVRLVVARGVGWVCRVFKQEGDLVGGGREVGKRVGGWEPSIENRGSCVNGRWPLSGPRADRDCGMGGLKFAGGNLRGDQGPASCACYWAAGF
jgi:hypothetical protein